MKLVLHRLLPYTRLFILIICFTINQTHTHSTNIMQQPQTTGAFSQRIIEKIIISGTSQDQILRSFFTQLEGEVFDVHKLRPFIRNAYQTLKRFRDIKVYGELVGQDHIIIHISVEEKPLLKEIIFHGNTHISEKVFQEKMNILNTPAVDPQELGRFVQQIKKLYQEKGYHNVEVETQFEKDDKDYATLIFNITENESSIIKRINFIGNNHISSKQLRSILYSREDWILSFYDKSGQYHPEMIEADKQMIEQHYQDRGYYRAKVIDAQVILNADHQFEITFEIQEGALYTIESVSAPGNDILSESELLTIIPLRPGQIYSRKLLTETMKFLERVWGNRGYVFAHISPMIYPDDTKQTLSCVLHSDIGNPITLHSIHIRGNKKTRDKIIRRQIILDEGDLVTSIGMDASKNRIESLGYFQPRDGVNWQLTRLNDREADLDLILKEAKTGNAGVQLNFGGRDRDVSSVVGGLAFEGTVADTNLLGTGIQTHLTARLSKDDKSFLFNITQPWMFDKPIYSAFDLYHKRVGYEELRHTRPVNEIHTGGSITAGLSTGYRNTFIFSDMFLRTSFGIDNIRYEHMPIAAIPLLRNQARIDIENSYNNVLRKLFDPGIFPWLSFQAGQEKRNHPMHPSAGYGWMARLQFAIPGIEGNIGFAKFDVDWHWYTPLIGSYNLIFHLHGYAGIIHPLSNHLVPYRELYHIGGPASIRGFLFGQVGPRLVIPDSEGILRTDSLGATRAAFINAELIFPITSDFSMKGVIFYDGGSGWKNPYAHCLPCNVVRDNSPNYRHSVGFGIRVLSPVPVKVDWGFKIDPRKGEVASEVHFGMSYGF